MTDKKEVIHWKDNELIWARAGGSWAVEAGKGESMPLKALAGFEKPTDIPYTYECKPPDLDGISTIKDITVVHVHGEGPVPVMEFVTRALRAGILIKWPSVFRIDRYNEEGFKSVGG